MTNTQNVIETNTKPCKRMYVAQTSPALDQLNNANKKRITNVKTTIEKDAKTGKDIMTATCQYKNIELEKAQTDQQNNFNFNFNEFISKIDLLAQVRLAKNPVNRVIDFDSLELQELLGLPQSNNTRRNLNRWLKDAVDTLVGLSIMRTDIENEKNSKNEPFFDKIVIYSRGVYPNSRNLKRLNRDEKAMHPESAVEFKLGHAYLFFSTDFLDHIEQKHQITLIAPKLFKLTGSAFYIYNALLNNKQINYKNSASRQDTMKIRTLLDRCPVLPTWEEVAQSNRHFYDRIVEPLENALAEINSEVDYVFLNKNREPVKSINNLPLNEFLDSYIKITNWKTLDVEQLNKVKRIKPKGKDDNK